MGCDIHPEAQHRTNGRWHAIIGNFAEGPCPFDWRDYSMFAFLANVRNYSDIPPLSEPRGLPSDNPPQRLASRYEDEDYGDHSFSWLSVQELLAFDYDQTIEDRRVTVQDGPNSWNGGATAKPGGGEMTTYRQFLGTSFFADLAELERIGAERIVFGFDS